jgi:AraC family transcriptional activator of pobA
MDTSFQFWYRSNMDQIATFNLFGEDADLPDVVHCETIEERSVTHDWEFRPHRHARLHQVLLLERGGGQALIEEVPHPLPHGCLVNMPRGVVHGFRFEPGTEGWVVTLASELLDQTLRDGEGLRPVLSRPRVLNSTNDINTLTRRIFAEYPTRGFARAHILRSLSTLLLGLVARELAEEVAEVLRPDTRLQRRFETLIETHYRDHLGVADYARDLAVTPTHLSRVMRMATGRPASAAIEERVIREARRNLAFSNLSIQEVAYQLGYNDPAYFSRVFARATGQSPRAFRRALEAKG